MNHKPVCAKCSKDMFPKKNGVGVLDFADYGPYQVWDADLWGCRECGAEIVIGFGQSPIARHDDGVAGVGSLAWESNWYMEHSRLIEVKP